MPNNCNAFLSGLFCLLMAGACFGDSTTNIQSVVKGQLNAHGIATRDSTPMPDIRISEYQTAADLARARGLLSLEQLRKRKASSLAGAGPVSLDALMRFSMAFNDEIQAARARLHAAEGEKIIAWSRFLPHLSYVFTRDVSNYDSLGREEGSRHAVRLSQRIFEFGGDHPNTVALRKTQRNTLFAYEKTVRRVLWSLRTKYFTVLLRKQQIEERSKLLLQYRQKYERMKGLEKARRVLEVDVLTTKLNVLNEEARINELKKRRLREELDLMKLAGFPLDLKGLELAGSMENLDVEVEECVKVAMLRSTSIAQARATVFEQARKAKHTWWEHAPSVGVSSGWEDSLQNAGIGLKKENGVFGISTHAERTLSESGEAQGTDFKSKGWYVNLTLDFPIMKGLSTIGKHKKERALLERDLHLLRSAVDSVELKVKQSYYRMLEEQKELEIRRETAVISRERLRIQEQLKELGKIGDNELETFRNRFFVDQDRYYGKQISLIQAQEQLRYEMRWFEAVEDKSSQ